MVSPAGNGQLSAVLCLVLPRAQGTRSMAGPRYRVRQVHMATALTLTLDPAPDRGPAPGPCLSQRQSFTGTYLCSMSAELGYCTESARLTFLAKLKMSSAGSSIHVLTYDARLSLQPRAAYDQPEAVCICWNMLKLPLPIGTAWHTLRQDGRRTQS